MNYKININVLNLNSSNALSTIKTNYYRNFNDTINDFNNNVVSKCSSIRTFNITSLVLKIYKKEKENLEMLNNLIEIINDSMELYDTVEQEKIEIKNPNLNSAQVISNDMSSLITSNNITSNYSSKLTIPVLGEGLGIFTLKRGDELADAAQRALDTDQSGENYWYGDYAWCANFVTKIIEETGLKEHIGIDKIANTAAVAEYENYFKSIDKFIEDNNYTPKPGDLIIYSKYSHIGIVHEVTDNYIYTIEGNTSLGGGTYQINKCSVDRSNTGTGTYNASDVCGYCVWE